jgi:hypothetical protein
LTCSRRNGPSARVLRDSIGIGVAADGTFQIDDLPPTGYRVHILALLEEGNREVGSVHVVVPPGGVIRVDIPVEPS